MHLVTSATIMEPSKDDDSVAIEDGRVLVNANRARRWLACRSCRGDHIPMETLKVQTVHHVAFVVSFFVHCSTDQIHISANNDAFVMGDLAWNGPTSLDFYPLEVMVRAVLHVSDLTQIDAPKVVQSANTDVIAAEYEHSTNRYRDVKR